MRKEKFHVVLFAPNKKELQKLLAAKGVLVAPEDILSKADLKNAEIEEEIGRFVSHDHEDYALIAKALKRELKKNPSQLIDHVKIKKDETITPIEALEFTYTVKTFCDMVGIKESKGV